MKITWLGTGSAFCMKNFQTNALITFDSGYKLLVDCGGDIRRSLADNDMTFLDINGIYISHLHADHIGGLEYMAFTSYFDPRYKGCPDLYVAEHLVDDLWNKALVAGLASLQNQRVTLETYFDVHAIPKNGSFHMGGIRFRLLQVVHFLNQYTFELSFGLMFRVKEETIFLTTDTQHAPNQIKDYYDEATVIFQDCETSLFPSGVHAHYKELCDLPEETKAKMRLIHYQDNVVAEWQTQQVNARNQKFWGFVKQGATFIF